MGKKAAPEVVEVRYDLFDLPTAQHKAGLAGLVLAIRSLKDRSEKDPDTIPPNAVPEIIDGPDETGVTIRFTERSVRGLFDDLYDAAVVRVAVKSKWSGVDLKGVESVKESDPRTGKTKIVKLFLYDTVQSKGTILAAWLPPPKESSENPWLKLWRDMLWQIPRGIPTTRRPFHQRAAGEQSDEGASAWESLVKAQGAKENNSFATGSVSGSLWLGAQATNAEGVPFVGRVEQNLLLHFWQLTVMISVPQRINNDGSSEFVGFVIAVPEVSNLERFCVKFPSVLSLLGTDLRHFRPARAVIDLPAQAALEFVNSVARLKVAEEEEHPMRSVNAVEFLHLDRQGKNVKLLTSGRVAADLDLLDRYRDIVGRPGELPHYRNPLFRAALLQALLRGKPWWAEMLLLFMSRDARFFVSAEATPEEIAWLPRFWNDAHSRLKLDMAQYQDRRTYMQMSKRDPHSSPEGESTPLTSLINRLVRNYVYRRAEERSGTRLDSFRDGGGINWERVPAPFNTEKAKIAMSLFLEFRSRREQAFVDHFAQTFFAVPQYMSDSDRDQEQIAQALLFHRRIDDIKTLTLMALSAVSWSPQR